MTAQLPNPVRPELVERPHFSSSAALRRRNSASTSSARTEFECENTAPLRLRLHYPESKRPQRCGLRTRKSRHGPVWRCVIAKRDFGALRNHRTRSVEADCNSLTVDQSEMSLRFDPSSSVSFRSTDCRTHAALRVNPTKPPLSYSLAISCGVDPFYQTVFHFFSPSTRSKE